MLLPVVEVGEGTGIRQLLFSRVCATVGNPVGVDVTPRNPQVDVEIAATMNDGQGVDAVTAQIHKPGGQVWTSPMAMVAGDANAGTYQAIYAAGPNTNAPDAWGNQAAQTYNVRIVGEDVWALSAILLSMNSWSNH